MNVHKILLTLEDRDLNVASETLTVAAAMLRRSGHPNAETIERLAVELELARLETADADATTTDATDADAIPVELVFTSLVPTGEG